MEQGSILAQIQRIVPDRRRHDQHVSRTAGKDELPKDRSPTSKTGELVQLASRYPPAE